MSESVPSSPIHSHSCSLPNQTLWFGRAVLYEDRVTIRGWNWQGRFHEEILMERIEGIDWRPVPDGPNLILHLTDGSNVRLRIKTAGGLWNAKLQELLGESVVNQEDVANNGRPHEESDQETA